MAFQTNLRGLRQRHKISLRELAVSSKLSTQYISRAELGQIAATPGLEKQMASALEAVIRNREERLRELKADYMTKKDALLGKEENRREQ